MTNPIPLILADEAVGAMNTGPVLRPGAAIVYTEKDGTVIGPQGRPTSLRERLAIKHRFIVDVADKESRIEFGLPARGDVFFFPTVLDVSWRVDRPWIVVARGVRDGYQLLETRLRSLMRQLSHEFEPNQVAAAEQRINSRFGANPGQLPEGVAIHRCYASLAMDPAYREILHTQQLDIIREEMIQRMIKGDPSGITSHLLANPGDTRVVIDEISANRKLDIDTRIELINQLRAAGVLMDADLAQLGQKAIETLTHLTGSAGGQVRQQAEPDRTGPKAINGRGGPRPTDSGPSAFRWQEDDLEQP